MAQTVKEELNRTQGQELKLPCAKCAGKAAHIVKVAVDKHGSDTYRQWSIDWSASYQVVQCNGCKELSFRSVSSTSEDYVQISEDEWDIDEVEHLYPSRVEGRKGLGNDVYLLPYKLQEIYNETSQALVSGVPILAGIGLRAIIETVCKEKNAAGNNLLQQIDDLVNKNVLTPSGSAILHKIRTLGNKSAHEVEPHGEKQLGLAMDVAEHLLSDIYILPKKVEQEFKDEA